MTAWPDPKQPGVPLNPEREGWHVVRWPGTGDMTCQWWRRGITGALCWAEWRNGHVAAQYEYHGLVLTPAEVAALVERAWRDGAHDAEETLSAWFDLAEKMEAAGADVLRDSLDTWLRRASSGGMPPEKAALVKAVLDEAARVYLWKALVPVLRGMTTTARREEAEAMRERAAAECSSMAEDNADDFAAAVRALPLPGGDACSG